MFQPISNTSTQSNTSSQTTSNTSTKTFIEDGWIKKTEQGISPSSKRIKKWFEYDAMLCFNYDGKSFTGKITVFFTSDDDFHIEKKCFKIEKIETFTSTYFFKPIPTQIIYEKTGIKEIYSEILNSAPSLKRMNFFYNKQLPMTIGYSLANQQTNIIEKTGEVKKIHVLNTFISYCTLGDKSISTQEMRFYRSNYGIKRSYPLLESSKNEDVSQIKVLLISGSQTFTVNWERLKNVIPHFESLCTVKPLSKEMREYDFSHLLNEQQLVLLLKYLNRENKLNQRNALDLYSIAVLMKMDDLKEVAKHKAIRYLKNKGTRKDIDLILQQPILKKLSVKLGEELLSHFQRNYHVSYFHLYPIIQDYFNPKLRPWKTEYPEIEYESINKGLKNFKLFSHIKEFSFKFDHIESFHIKDILRICEIFGSQIEALFLNRVEDCDVPLIVSSLKEKNLKAILFDSEIPYTNNNVKQPPNQNGLTKNGIAQLITLFQTLPELEEFRFENHQFDDEGVKLISDFIQNHPRLKTITLNTPFSEIALKELCKSINTTKIEALILEGIGLGNYKNYGSTRWFELISENKNLKILSLDNNNLKDKHLDSIIYIIKNNTCLEIIDLLNNVGITNKGRKKLKDALQDNTMLKELNIFNSHSKLINLVEKTESDELP